MNQRERDALDRHITGNNGEDQLRADGWMEAFDRKYLERLEEKHYHRMEDVEDPFDFPDPTPDQLEEIRAADLAITGISTKPTRYAVICVLHGRVYMTKEEYIRQMYRADDKWCCPSCGAIATFDDETYEEGT